jgi:hypothetical protein
MFKATLCLLSLAITGYAELNGVFPLPGPRARAFLQLFPFIGNFLLVSLHTI